VDAFQPLGRLLIIAGVVLLVVGTVLTLGVRIPWLGNLPGDIRIQRDNVTIFIPLGTMVVVSLVLSLALSLLNRSR
jgi:Protein of unknown function (DUF2905)